VLKVGVALSVLVIPLAVICGHIRSIPIGWRLIDCSFGIFCLPFLCFALRKIQQLIVRNP
jgi:dolichyl-phosphate-mannose--protein O-mannosyl transferase